MLICGKWVGYSGGERKRADWGAEMGRLSRGGGWAGSRFVVGVVRKYEWVEFIMKKRLAVVWKKFFPIRPSLQLKFLAICPCAENLPRLIESEFVWFTLSANRPL